MKPVIDAGIVAAVASGNHRVKAHIGGHDPARFGLAAQVDAHQFSAHGCRVSAVDESELRVSGHALSLAQAAYRPGVGWQSLPMSRARRSRPCQRPDCGNQTLHRSGFCHHHRHDGHDGAGELSARQKHAALTDSAAAMELLEMGYPPSEVLGDGCVEATFDNDDARGPGRPLVVYSRSFYDDLGPPLLLLGNMDTRVDVETACVVLRTLDRLANAASTPPDGRTAIKAYGDDKHYESRFAMTADGAKIEVDNGEGGQLAFLHRFDDDHQGRVRLEFTTERGEPAQHHLHPEVPGKLEHESFLWHQAAADLGLWDGAQT